MDVLHTVLPRIQEKQDLQLTIFGNHIPALLKTDRVKYFLNFLKHFWENFL